MTTKSKVFEISLLELLQVIVKGIPLIICGTILFVAATYVYFYVLKTPVYYYEKLIKLPNTIKTADQDTILVIGQEKLSFVHIFKNDIGNENIWTEGIKGKLTDVGLVYDRGMETNLIKFRFEGIDSSYTKLISEQYVNNAVNRINSTFEEVCGAEFNKMYFRALNNDIHYVRNSINDGTKNAEDAVKFLMALQERADAFDKKTFIARARVVDDTNTLPAKVNDRHFVIISAFIGFFLCIVYVISKYIWKQAVLK